MAFNADEYIGVIFDQIGTNFSELENAVKNCLDLEKAIREYDIYKIRMIFLFFKKPQTQN